MSAVSRHPDREGIGAWLLTSLLLSAGLASGLAGQMAARGRLDPSTGFLVGALVTPLAILGLPSLSIRLVARAVLALSALMLVRFGIAVGGVGIGGQALVAWAVCAVAVFVLTDRIGTDANPPLAGEAAAGARPVGSTLRSGVLIAVAIVTFAVLATPTVARHVGHDARVGDGPNLGETGSQTTLRAARSLDMTTRPNLTDEVVFTVDANRRTFWRGETFDRWDGRSWTRSDASLRQLDLGDQLSHEADDLGAEGSDVVTQTFRIQVDYANVLYAAASASSIDTKSAVVQHPDGTMVGGPLGKGAVYTVRSQRIPYSESRLREADGPVPAAVQRRYASPPVATDRVREAALRATRGATSTYDKIVALEAWMGGRTHYSLDAPLAPKGVDVVDHFLFTSKEGWCEQIASSLVVLARSSGIPARLVTGFVPGEQDPITGQFTVRARDAHAWAEVWFPTIGWVPFDPTADVPFAGADKPSGTWANWLAHHWAYLAAGLAVALVAAGPLRSLVRRGRARRAARPTTWITKADRALARLGERADRPRRPGETATAFGAALAVRYRDERLAEVGRCLDDAMYDPDPPTPDRQAAADAVLADVAAADVPALDEPAVPAPEPAGTPTG